MSDEFCPHCPPLRHPVLRTRSTVARLATRGRRTNPGYTLVTTRRHVADLGGLDWRELLDLSRVAVRTMDALQAELGAAKVTVRLNWGSPGQHAPHVHLHLVPRFVGDAHHGYLPGPLEDVDPRAAVDLAGRVRSHLAAERPAAPAAPVRCVLRRHRLDQTSPGHPCVSVQLPSRRTRRTATSDVALASALLAVTEVADEVIGRGRVTGLTLRLAGGAPRPLATDTTLLAYPRWPDDEFTGAVDHSCLDQVAP